MAKVFLCGPVVALFLSGCIQSSEHTDCMKVAQYVTNESSDGDGPAVMLTRHERRIGDGLRLRGIGDFPQHAYLEAYSVCKSIEAGNGVKVGRL